MDVTRTGVICQKPYEWAGVSVVRMLEKPEYMGDTVNFRTKKLPIRIRLL